METTITHTPGVGNHNDVEYDAFIQRIQERFLANTEDGALPVFTTDANKEAMWEAYLYSFDDPVERQYHNCDCCRQFIQHFGGLVVIEADGSTTPAIWNEVDAPEAYKRGVAAMYRIVERAKITGVFLNSNTVWGSPHTGIWSHFAVTPPKSMVFRDRKLTAYQAMAAKKQGFEGILRALGQYKTETVSTALKMLRTNSIYRGEKLLGPVEWFYDLKCTTETTADRKQRINLIWLAVAKAPEGFLHIGSGVVSTLFDDIVAGKSFHQVAGAMKEKMDPGKYLRPQAAPAAGAIAAAEKLVEKLGITRSLERRFARLDELLTYWKPWPKLEPEKSGVFGHLTPKGEREVKTPGMTLPPQTMTWAKFSTTVMTAADKIEFLVPVAGSFFAFLTATHADAPPIIQWDDENERNPVSWYVYRTGCNAERFNLQGGVYTEVEALTLYPSLWTKACFHLGQGVMMVLKGAQAKVDPDLCLFPEVLKSDLHEVRSVIEAHSASQHPTGRDKPHAAGYVLMGNKTWNAKLRVTTAGETMEYILDRWD